MLECYQISNLFLTYESSDFNKALKFYMDITDDSFTFDDTADATCDLYYKGDYSYTTSEDYFYKMNMTVDNTSMVLNMNVYNHDNDLKYSRSIER